MSCKGIHCPGCGDGGGAGIGAVVIFVVLAVIAADAKAVGRLLAEVGRILVLAAIAGASVTAATGAVILAVAIHRKLRRIERATDKMRVMLTSPSYGELSEPDRAELPARADLPAEVYIHPPRARDEVAR